MKKKTITPKVDTFALINEFDDKQTFIDYVSNLSVKIIKTNKKIEYLNVPSVVDIESSSFVDTNGNKTGIMYCFTIGINGHSYFGRTYDELFEMLQLFTDTFQLNKERRLIVYVHNLAFEFQFFYKRFTWLSVFNLKPRTPVYALSTGGIEFRCSLILSGYSLAKVGEHLQKYHVEKKVGDLNYELIRHSSTPMTKEEIGYVLNDGLVVMAYIQEQIESHRNDITKIPLTKTGEVRKYCRDVCLYGGGGTHKKAFKSYNNYRYYMSATQILSVQEYEQLKRAFMGGFTHANATYTGNIVKNVKSFDFTSSYPYVMLSEKFPMSRGELYQIKNHEDLMKQLHLYCCVFDITFFGLESTINFEHYISHSRCINVLNYTLDNGRIVDAEELSITITEQDYFIIEKCYRWRKIQIKRFRRYKKRYLPKPFMKSIIQLYKQKTQLKGVQGMESEYLHSKELLNSCYGMSVTDICREEIPFDVEHNTWDIQPPEIDYVKTIERYNKSKQRFLSYAWGIWVTAYARRNLWTGIFEFGNHYLYSDTDSIKVVHSEEHQRYFDEYNANVLKKLTLSLGYHNLPIEDVNPVDINGEHHLIGVWDDETKKGDKYTYSQFKTLGAKRYMVKYPNGKYSLTISGLNKKTAIPYLLTKNTEIMDEFQEYMYIPPDYTGKMTHTYIDEERIGVVTDYLGNTEEYHELTCVHLAKADYTLSLARDYVDYLLLINELEYN